MGTKTLKRTVPAGSTAVCPYMMVESVESLMEFLVKVFNATITNDINRKDGFIQHGEVLIGDTTIMLGRASREWPSTQNMNYVYVKNADEVYERALNNGATAIMPPDNKAYGIREGGFKDQYGNQWWVAQLMGVSDNSDDDALIEAELLWSKSLEGNNVEEISKFMTEDWIIIGTEGGISSKNDFLTPIKNGELVHTAMDFEIMRTRIYNNIGVIISKGTSAGTYKLNPFSFYEWSTSLFIKEGNQWKAVLTMLTQAKKNIE
jgi:PhnB protein